MKRFFFSLGLLALAAGCGRTSLLGDAGEGCPPDQVLVDGQCVPKGFDGGLFDFARPDGFRGDMRGDGFQNGDMSNCKAQPEICDNKKDDNCNGLVDCDDPGCAGDSHCVTPGQEICNNGVDDDKDGLIDCKDPDCFGFPGCQPHVCDPNMPDCTDPACVDNPKCQNLICMPTVDFGTLQQHDSKSEKVFSTVGTKDVAVTPCAPGGGGMVVTQFTVASDNTSVKLDFTQVAGADHVFGLFRAGVNQKCEANPIDCYDPKSAPSGTHTWTLAAGHYYLIVQAFTPQHQGSVDATLSTPPAKNPEICNNGIDDDGNGLIDCADPACLNDASCTNKECKPDTNVGTLVLGAPPAMASFDTGKLGSRYDLSCAAGGGADYAVEFSLAETVGVLMQWDQSGDHVVELFRLPPNGSPCDAQPLGCYDPSGRQQDLVAWGELPPGSYLFIWQALQKGDEGHVDVQLSAYRNRKIELCHNGIDDDGDGLVDCADPDCFADAGCGAPVCMPDVNLGTLHLGDQASTTINTTQGVSNETVSCAKGGGKAKVIQVTLAENAGMGFDCQETGDMVLGLFAQSGPRDSCDKNPIDCADPKVLPFGCGYEIPNLQPGTYYVIVEAFQAGSEGTMDLTLSSIQDRALEICNNGIDDDMDGFTDCADRKCATSPFCIPKACIPDVSIDPMPIGGQAVFELVQTAGKQVSAQPPCEVKPGGGDAVIFLNMPAQASLQIDYAQVGNHVIAIYPDLGNGLICEAAKSIGCQASGGAGAGTVKFLNIAGGPYWVIVAADQPGDEGSASLKFTAQ